MAELSPEKHRKNFKYKKLDSDNEFRTLTITLDEDDMPVCTLKHQPLPSKAPPDLQYDAISWYWGTSGSITPVYIVDEDGNEKVLSVRPNLVKALKGLYDKSKPDKLFWIDAICINQSLSHERDLQVQHMAEIYSYAQNVRIWLGDEGDQSKVALDFIEKRVCNLSEFETITTDEGTLEQWKALAALMNRPWFSRRWVVQELALAKKATIHCGTDHVHWTDFETAVALFERNAAQIAKQFRGSFSADFDPEFFGDVTNMRATRLVHAKNNLFRMNDDGGVVEYRFTLMELVSNLSFFEAKEPRDLIYAILSLAKDTHAGLRTASRPNAQEAVNQAAALFDEEPFETGSPTSGSSSSRQSRGHETRSATPKKRASTSMIDVARLTKSQKTGLQKVVRQLKQVAQPENTMRFPDIKYDQRFLDLCKQFLNFAVPKMEFPNLDILCRPWAPEALEEDGRELSLPSWIPRATGVAFGIRVAEHAPGQSQMKRKNADPLVGQTTDRAPYYNASRSMKALKDEWRFGDISSGESDFSLFITGFVLDKIGTIEDASQNGHIPLEWIHMGGWHPRTKQGERDPRRRLPDELWRTLVGDRGPEGGNPKIYYRQAFEYAVNRSTPDVGIQTAELKQRGHPVLIELLDRIEAVVWNRRLFRSDRAGYLGLAPKQAKEGEYICIIRGISVPVILRKARDGTHYTLVGECYVHTMMSGQAMEIQERKLAEWKAEREGSGAEATLEEILMETQTFELR